MSTVLLQARGLVPGRSGRGLTRPIDLTLHRGRLVALVGPNGSGKTTLLRTLGGLLPPVAGTVEPAPGLRLGWIGQRVAFDDVFHLTAAEVAGLGGGDALAGLERVGAASMARRPFRALSEGQKQRVLTGRLVASQVHLGLLDEPTAAMDVQAEQDTVRLLRSLADAGLALLVVSHHVAELLAVSDEVIELGGRHG